MIKDKTRRKFLGKINNFISKEEANFEDKHLRSYLKGKKYFSYGKDEKGDPKIYEVKQEFYEAE